MAAIKCNSVSNLSSTMSLKIGSWNIQGLRDKADDSDFINILNDYDIFILSETWMDKSANIDGYIQFSKYRKKSKNNRIYGGITILVKNMYKKGVQEVQSKSQHCVAINLKKEFFGFHRSITLCGVYIPPEKSSSWNNSCDNDPFYDLQQLVCTRCITDDILLCGDFNARVGKLQDYIVDDSFDGGIDTSVYIPDHEIIDRMTYDSTVNNFGRKLINLCRETQLRLVNGRALGDLSGKYTCYQKNGNSVVDFVVVNEQLLQNIVWFKVHEPIHLSDHALISTMFHCKKVQQERDKSIRRDFTQKVDYVWDKTSKIAFQNALSSQEITGIRNEIDNIISQDRHPNIVNECVNKVTKIFMKAASTSLRKKTDKSQSKSKWKQKWYTRDCETLKSTIRHLGKMVMKCPNNPFLREQLVKCRKQYKKLIREKKREFMEKTLHKIYSFEQNNPKEYWKFVNGLRKEKQEKSSIDLENWVYYFKQLYADSSKVQYDKEFERMVEKKLNECKLEVNYNELLDKDITIAEIERAIKKCKNNKATGIDSISNEMIKASAYLFSSLFVRLFNLILRRGEYPNEWCKGILTPIFKGGNLDLTDNYRGISILSCIGKLFNSILNKRIVDFLQSKGIIHISQIGFKENCRTSDHVFVLKTIIDYYKKKRKFVFGCFVDFRKAYDSVWHSGLLVKLYEYNLGSKMVNLIENMYLKAKSCVKANMDGAYVLSEFFSLKVGTRQGCNLSPTLFNLFINDLPLALEEQDCDAIKVGNLHINTLMFADDVLLLSNSASGLQKALDCLAEYCFKWKLSINMKKTKVMIFNKNFENSKKMKFMINNVTLEVCSEYVYLGVVIVPSGSFSKAAKRLANRGGKSYISWNTIVEQKISQAFNVNLKLKLFDTLTKPVLLYNSEVWAVYDKVFSKSGPCDRLWSNNKMFEKIHRKFCKQTLKVQRRTSNLASLAELGRYPLIINVIQSIMVYWNRIKDGCSNSLVNEALLMQHELHQTGHSMYLKNIENLCKLIGKNSFKGNEVKVSLYGMYEDYFKKCVQEGKLELYGHLKKVYRKEGYLTSSTLNSKQKRALVKCRISAHKLPIETGRFENRNRAERLCTKCSIGEVGDEFHCLFKCTDKNTLQSRKEMMSSLTKLNPQIDKLPERNLFVYLLSAGDLDMLIPVTKHILLSIEM